jgi:beta-glucanase (GH16 family)
VTAPRRTTLALLLGALGAGAAPAGAAPRLAWSDEFTGPARTAPDGTKWTYDWGAWGWGHHELQYYTPPPANAALDGRGHLAITARRGRIPGTRRTGYTSGKILTRNRVELQYGQIEARIRIPRGKGLLAAFWTLGADNHIVGWPRSGELDIMEFLGQATNVLLGAVHGPLGRPGPHGRPDYGLESRAWSRRSFADGFHVYGVRWSPRRVTFTLDGRPYGTWTPRHLPRGASWVFERPQFLVLSLAVGGEWPGRPNAQTRLPRTMLVDWVRVYDVRVGARTIVPRLRKLLPAP